MASADSNYENQDQNSSSSNMQQPIPAKSRSQPPPPSSPPTLPPNSQSAVDDTKQSQGSESTSNDTSTRSAAYNLAATGFSAFTTYIYGDNNPNAQPKPDTDAATDTSAQSAPNGTVKTTQSLSAIDRQNLLQIQNGTRPAPLAHVQSAPLPTEQKDVDVDAELFAVCPETMATSENEQTAARDSDLFAVLDNVSVSGIDNEWTKAFQEPSPETVLLRSRTYTADGCKEVNAAPVFRLAAVQSYKTEHIIDHVAMHPSSWYNQNIALDDMSTFTIIVHLQVKSLKTSFITYHCLCGEALKGYNSRGTPIVRGDRAVTRLLDLVLNCDDEATRNNRLKLIPRIVEGPYPVKRVVENRPVLLGNKIKQTYFRGPNYFEIDSKVDESMVAASIIKLCHRFAKRIVVDMAWTIQGEQVQELPERLLCACSVHNMDFSKVGTLSDEMQQCHRLRYKEAKSNDKEEEEEEQVSDDKQ